MKTRSLLIALISTVFLFVTNCSTDNQRTFRNPDTSDEVYSVRFDANGGTGSLDDRYFSFGTYLILPDLSQFSKEGYVAVGWGTDPSAAVPLEEYYVPSYDSALYIIWQIDEFIINFDANGGIGSMPSQTAFYEAAFSLPDTTAFSKVGYSALGWNTDPLASTALVDYQVPGGEITLYVIWQINDYTISFDANGGSGSMLSQTVTYDTDFSLPDTTAFNRVGYSALGWNTDPLASTTLTSYTVPDSDSILYVIWEVNSYIINFDANGGSGNLTSQTVVYDTNFSLPDTTAFSRLGYNSLGWNTDPLASTAFTSYTVPASDNTLYVIWQINDYIISFDANSGVGSMPSQTAIYGSDFPLPATTSFTRSGYTALGWNTDSLASTALTSYIVPDSDSTLYVIWQINDYTISFDANSGIGSMPSQTAIYGSDFPLPETTSFTKEGYTALGWNNDASATAALTSYVVPANDNTLYVIWQINDYIISFDANSGVGSMPSQTAIYGSDFPLPATTSFIRSGYTALGWNTDSLASTALTSYIVPDSDSTLYVIWQINDYIISFDANSGVGSMPSQTAIYGSDFPLPATTSFTRSGYTALGWNTDSLASTALTSYTVPDSDSTLYVIWQINDYIISFDANGGSGSLASQTAVFNSDFPLPETTIFIRTGYIPIGWNTDSLASTALTSYTVPASDSTLYVVWGTNSYTVSFDANGGSGSLVSQTVEFNSDFPFPATTAFTRSGYNAIGWNTNSSATAALSSYTVPASDSTLYVVWGTNSYTVSFDANGGSGSLASQTAEFNSDFPLPATNAFTRSGYNAIGWNTNSSATAALSSYTVPASDSTLYVVWGTNSYTVSFDANGGSGSLASQTAEFNSDFPLPATTIFTRSGYNAIGWNTNSSATAALSSYTVPASDSTLYVVWGTNSYTVSFDANGGSGSLASQTAEFNSDFPLPATTTFTRSGYNAIGWNTNSSATAALSSYTVPASDSTLYVVWGTNSYTVSFDANGGSGSLASQTAEFNSDFPLPATTTFTRSGYNAIGWNTNSSATAALSSYTVPASDSTLYVVWGTNSYTVSFDANGGSGSLASQTAEFNSDFPLPATTTFTRSGYNAIGWNTNSSATAALSSYTVPASDSTLYVVWGTNSYTVSFDANGGSGSLASQTAEFNSDFPLPATTTFTRSGYNAIGWNTNSSATAALSSYTVPASDSTLYVVWGTNSYTVSFDANGGSGSLASQTAIFGSNFTLPSTSSFGYMGYNAIGWNTNSSATAALSSYTVPASDSTLYVVWGTNSYTVSFDANGGSGSLASQTAEFNSDFPLPATTAFTRSGYNAIGWNTNSSATAALSSYTVPASDSTLYVVWGTNSYTISFDANGGSGSIPSQSAPYLSSFTLPDTIGFTKTGHVAIGWNTDSSASTTLTAYTVPNSDSTLYIVWDPTIYNISFDANGGSGSLAIQSAGYGSNFTLPSTSSFGYMGHTAIGWNTNSSASTALTSYTIPAADSTLYVIWQANSYTVSFDANGGSGSLASQTAIFGSNFTLPSTSSFGYMGYNAIGWNTNSSATAALSSYTVPASDSTLYVVWGTNSYTVSFDANGGSGSLASQTAEFNSDFPLPATTAFTRSGYNAIGWNTNSSATAALSSYTVPASDSTLYVVWGTNSYTISFDANGGSGSIPSQSAPYLSSFTLPDTIGFTKTGHVAIGWNTDSSASTTLTAYTVPNSDSTLYIVWDPTIYNISFDANGGSGSLAIQSAGYGSNFTLPSTSSFGYMGHTAIGWNTNSSASTALTSYTIPAADSTLYVIWQANSYTISFVANGGSGSIPSQTAEFNSNFPLPATTAFTRSGYNAIGWNTNSSASTALTSYSVPAFDSTLYIIWDIASYSISFNANGGSGSMSSQTAIYGSDFPLPATTGFTRLGYSALGWHTDSASTTAFTSYSVPAFDSTLYVVWGTNSYTISFDANGGSGSLASQTAPAGSNFTLPSASGFTKLGVSGVGWDIVPGSSYSLTSYTVPSYDSTLYVVYEALNLASVSFDANGGTGQLSAQNWEIDVDHSLPSTTSFTRSGHNAVGWHTDANSLVPLSDPISVSTSTTFYVIWRPFNHYLLIYDVNDEYKTNNTNSVGSADSIMVAVGDQVPLPSITNFSWQFYTPLGWGSTPSSTTTLSSFTMPAADTTLYLVWHTNLADIDSNGMIDIRNFDDLYNIRFNPEGTSLKVSSGGLGNSAGCPGGTCVGYELVRNLDFRDLTNSQVAPGWEPIPSLNSIFKSFDKAISYLYINRPLDTNVGLFATTTAQSQMLSIKLDNVTVVGLDNVGALVGDAQGVISFVVIDDSNISAKGQNVGSTFGKASLELLRVLVRNSSISGPKSVGGVGGKLTCRIVSGLEVLTEIPILIVINGVISADPFSGSEAIGGMFGEANCLDLGDISITGNIAGQSYVGGLVGKQTGIPNGNGVNINFNLFSLNSGQSLIGLSYTSPYSFGSP